MYRYKICSDAVGSVLKPKNQTEIEKMNRMDVSLEPNDFRFCTKKKLK